MKRFDKMIFTILILIIGFLAIYYFYDYSSDKISNNEFCGSSSLIKCSIDSDCNIGGCSGQVCGASEDLFTICEWRDCYDAKKYNLDCRCVSNKCQWSEK